MHNIVFIEYTRVANSSKYVALLVHFDIVWVTIKLVCEL